ncbi:PX-associated-domain-containing protein [Chaetomium fimeti]|uniref:PX-associated-domain-containing protein n=1 Tax=Chaetomium fimeti TaxID=1854472 RepID=A0AAE0LPQ3_9PEZI|nr:PX-associated-domain-containing protein [Chaetomium fimeti]
MENPATDGSAEPAISVPEPSRTLTSSQLHALFDILTHHETYAEVESFKDPRAISEYGYPFARRSSESNDAPSYAGHSAAPLLAGFLQSIVLPFPGVRDLPPEFWHVRFQGILEKLSEAELSESYDKGVLGTRKTLATASSAIHETVSRGILGGVENGANRSLYGEYDRSEARDLARAWEDGVQELVYGNLIDELFSCAAEKDSLEEHSPAVQAAADYIILHLATLIHYVFILSPEGPYLLKLLENVHRLLPYSMVKQTLRIGNAASMLNGMVRLLLAKVGVGALSNWVGLTQNADDGMNLLQRIVWLVLSWDASEFRKSAEAIEKAKGASKEQLAAIKEYLDMTRDEHHEIRNTSAQKTQSIAATILERSNPSLLSSLTEAQHTQCLEYLSALLAARDRDEISNAFCRQNPDLFTQAVKDAVGSFESMIRTIHQKVDLREHLSAAEGFITAFINVTKDKKGSSSLMGSLTPAKAEASEARAPSVEDYVALLRNNRQLLYNWLHQVASQCPEIRDNFCAWAKETIKVFRQPENPEVPAASKTDNKNDRPGAAGALSSPLQHLFTALPPTTQARILPAIDAHATYLSQLEALSLTRMQRILDNMSTTTTTTATITAAISTLATTPSGPTTPSATAPPITTTTAATTTAPTSYFSPSYWSRSGRTTPRSPSPNPNPDLSNRSFTGPGMYLSRWQQLMDDTVIAPASATPGAGPLRTGRDVKGVLARGKIGSGSGWWMGAGGL